LKRKRPTLQDEDIDTVRLTSPTKQNENDADETGKKIVFEATFFNMCLSLGLLG
jgi:hypothetical protein